MVHIRPKRIVQAAHAVLLSLIASTGSAQDSEPLPTLKLDRIPTSPAFAGQTQAPAAATSSFTVTTVASGLSAPWALAFLPDGDLLITENVGNLRIVAADGSLSAPIAGLPEISNEGWAGLFDVALDPDFTDNQRIYFSYTSPSPAVDAANVPRVARARLDRDGLRLLNVEVIVDGTGGQEIHFGSGGRLYVSGAGDVFADDAQDLSTTFGKILRINPDGSVPADNPWTGDDRVPDAVWSYGHRDVSGMATHPDTGEIWMTEHGARGGDELNRIIAGANYGWPLVSYGTDYNGDRMGDGAAVMAGTMQPLYFWRPSIAPSGLTFYTGSMFPEWRSSVFVTALSGQHIARLELDGTRVVAEERLLVDRGQRIRELREGPDGALYALTNEESEAPKGTAELLRISRP